jgi:hypothetical protein
MKSTTVALATAIVLGALAGAGGCADNRASIQVQAVCVPTDDCTFSDTCDAQYIGYPTLDTTTSTSGVLWLILQVENPLPDNSDEEIGRVNTNDAHIDETVIEYEGSIGTLGRAAIGSNFYVPASGSAVVSVQVPLSGASAGVVIAKIRMRGYLDDDSRFETGEFPVAVRICAGCVGTLCAGAATCPPDSDGQLPLTCPQAEPAPEPPAP